MAGVLPSKGAGDAAVCVATKGVASRFCADAPKGRTQLGTSMIPNTRQSRLSALLFGARHRARRRRMCRK